MNSATDYGFNCPARGSLAPTEFWTVEIKLRGQWTPTDAFGWSEQDVTDDMRLWASFYPAEHIRAAKKTRT